MRTLASFAPPGTRLLLLNSFLATVPMGFLMVVVPLYLARIGHEPAFIGLLFVISGLVSSLLVAFSGILADRFGRVRFLVAGTALPITSYAILALTTDPAWLVVAAGLGGVGLANGAAGAMTVASYDALLAERTDPRTRTRVFASAQALWNLALAVGAATAGIPQLLREHGVGDVASYRPAFVAAIAIGVLATASILPLRERSHQVVRRTGWLPRASGRAIAMYSLAIGLLGFGLGVAVQLMPLWFSERFGVGEADLAPWYAVAQLSSIASVALVPWLERRFGAGRSIMAMQLGSGVILAAMVGLPAFWLAALFYLGRSFLTNVSWPFQQSLFMSTVAPQERGAAAGIGFAVWGVTNAIGPGVAGVLIGTGVLALPLLAGAVAYGAAGIVFGLGLARIHAARALAAVPVFTIPPPEPLP
ncbi:MAG: MFS transporter [Chloroflexota bacterium]|nr:MFS transporter [Chloroflexota bacterium]